jgi:hypothetical protein
MLTGVIHDTTQRSDVDMPCSLEEFVIGVFRNQPATASGYMNDDLLGPLSNIHGFDNVHMKASVGRRNIVFYRELIDGHIWIGFRDPSNVRIAISGASILSWIHGETITLAAIDSLALVASSSRESMSFLPRRDLQPATVLSSHEGRQLLENMAYMRAWANVENRVPYARQQRFVAPVDDVMDVRRESAGILSALLESRPFANFYPNSARNIAPIRNDAGESFRAALRRNAQRIVYGPLEEEVQILNDIVLEWARRKGYPTDRLAYGSDGLLLPFPAENASRWTRKEHGKKTETASSP